MNTTIKLLSIGLLFGLSSISFGQAPEGVNYQATVRNSSGVLMVNQTVAVIFTLRKTTATGTTVYSETQSLTTNNYGGMAAIIGQGTATSGTFASIDWANNKHFLNVSVNGNDLGTSEFQSVPYALHAKTATDLTDPIWQKRQSNGDYFTIGQPLIIGDSSQSASKLTIKETGVVSEVVDIRHTNGSANGDVINIEVLNTAGKNNPSQFLELRADGNTVTSLHTNGVIETDSTLKITDGEINVTSKTGTANLVPICYGSVSSTGTKNSAGSSSNWTVTKSSTGIYFITVNGEVINQTNYAIIITPFASFFPVTTSFGFNSTGTNAGKLLVHSWALGSSNALADNGFSFVIYKP